MRTVTKQYSLTDRSQFDVPLCAFLTAAEEGRCDAGRVERVDEQIRQEIEFHYDRACLGCADVGSTLGTAIRWQREHEL